MNGIQVLQTNELQTRKMLYDGVSYRQIGEAFGVSKDVVAYFCKLNNLSRGSNKNNEASVARKIREKSNGQLEYVSGYTKKENLVKVRCTICGGAFERTFHSLTCNEYMGCPVCKQKKQQQIESEKAFRKEREDQKKKAERFTHSQLIGMRMCAECGEMFIPRDNHIIRCSERCVRRAMNRGADARLNQHNVVDKDITLTKVFDRDNGVCWICGGKCNWDDYQTRNGQKIVGNDYPSKDHVIPLAKGGTHSWDNVRLAHWLCNTRKRDKILG